MNHTATNSSVVGSIIRVRTHLVGIDRLMISYWYIYPTVLVVVPRKLQGIIN